MTTTTREKILDAARSLFAEQGYRGTSIGDVEAAAGLTPRAGALYKHFASKEELLRAVVDRHATPGMDDLDAQVALLDLGDLRAEITLIGRLGLAELRREQDLIRIVMKEGDRFPEVATAFRALVVERSHALSAAWMRRKLEGAPHADDVDVAAVSAVLVEALVGFVTQEILVGEVVPEERFLSAWTQTAVALTTAVLENRSTNV